MLIKHACSRRVEVSWMLNIRMYSDEVVQKLAGSHPDIGSIPKREKITAKHSDRHIFRKLL